MRLSEILGSDVITERGDTLGKVRDVRLVQDGPLLGPWGHTLRVEALVVSRHGLGFDLGLVHGAVEGPKLLQALARLLHREHTIPWEDIVTLGAATVVCRDP